MGNEKKWYEVSSDELCHRMALKSKYHDEPISEGIKEMFRTINMLLREFGVITNELDDVEDQMNELGLKLVPNNEELTPQLHGYFIVKYVPRKIIDLDGDNFDIVPCGWVSKPHTKYNGTVAYCKWENFITDKKGETDGIQIAR
jgi:hypothetical protein